jgi:adenine-specific DNA-methyltransferase
MVTNVKKIFNFIINKYQPFFAMDGKSLTPPAVKFNQLKQIFPEVFTEDNIDWEKLRITLGENINFANERYVLNWAGKSDAFRLMQQPTTRTLMPIPEESVNFDDTQNIFIEGDNLDVLKILQKSYFGEVKMIYIDPPYNTGNDSFIYSDRFAETKDEYQKRVGDKDDEGYMTSEGIFRKNSRENGQYHSNWLNMMMPRLYLARTLLRDDGVIFISIDDNEVHNLRLLMNEIFGEENFFSQIIVRTNSRGQTYKQIAKTHEYILVYTKNSETELYELEKDAENSDLNLKDNISSFNVRELRNRNPKFGKHNRPFLFYPIYINPNIIDKDGFSPVSLNKSEKYSKEVYPYNSEGKESCWRWGKTRTADNYNEDTLISNLVARKKTDGNYNIYEKYRKTTYKPKSIWDDNSFLTETGTIELRKLAFNQEFDFPKPISLLKQIIALSTQDDDIILDFFAGSATTAHAVMELNKEDGGNRRYILVQMPEICEEKSEAYKAGYKTIADIAKERIRRAGKKLQDEIEAENKKKETQLNFDNEENISDGIDTGFKVFHLAESNFKQWQQPENYSAEALAEQLKLFIDPVAENANLQNMVYELLLKSGKDLNVNIETCNGYYLIEGNELTFILEKVDE